MAAIRSHGQWYAVAEDFDIVGVGPSEAAAEQELLGLVEAYLRSFHRDGRSYWDARRPIPRHRKLSNVVKSLLARGLRRTGLRFKFSEGARLLLPIAFRNGHP